MREYVYMLLYAGAKGNRTFNTHKTIEECKQDATKHATENPRLKGKYVISKVFEMKNNLVGNDFSSAPIYGVKRGKVIEWEA